MRSRRRCLSLGADATAAARMYRDLAVALNELVFTVPLTCSPSMLGRHCVKEGASLPYTATLAWGNRPCGRPIISFRPFEPGLP